MNPSPVRVVDGTPHDTGPPPAAGASPTESDLPALLGTSRTVDRRLVHRDAVAEVLLTDVVPHPDDATADPPAEGARFVVAVHVPRAHTYYGDHPDPVVDPVLLVEAVRQAAEAVSHGHLGVGDTDRFVVRDLLVDLVRPLAVASSSDGVVHAVLTLRDVVRVRGALRSVRVTADVRHARPGERPTRLGTVELAVAVLTDEGYAYLRGPRSTRGGAAELGRAAAPRQGLVDAVAVARSRAENVVVADPRHGADGSTARLEPAFANASMFDHPQDHVPAMVLVEAVRQLVVHRALAGHDVPPAPGALSLAARFLAFVELDAVAELRLTAVGTGRSVVRVLDQAAGTELAELRMVAGA